LDGRRPPRPWWAPGLWKTEDPEPNEFLRSIFGLVIDSICWIFWGGMYFSVLGLWTPNYSGVGATAYGLGAEGALMWLLLVERDCYWVACMWMGEGLII
jgi:hypothetical protein